MEATAKKPVRHRFYLEKITGTGKDRYAIIGVFNKTSKRRLYDIRFPYYLLNDAKIGHELFFSVVVFSENEFNESREVK